MKPTISEQLRELASLYMLGLLEEKEARAFEQRLNSGDLDCIEALADEEKSAALLAQSLEPTAPPPGLKAKLMRTIPKPKAKGFGAILANEGKWQPGPYPGIRIKPLYFDKASGLLTLIMQLEPGAHLPKHLHAKPEQCLILEGEMLQDDEPYLPGDFIWADAGSVHTDVSTKTGATVLLITAPEPQVID